MKKKGTYQNLFTKYSNVFIERLRWAYISPSHPGLSGRASRQLALLKY